MLAYVFWHWPQPSGTQTSYIDHLIVYHEALAALAPAGFIRSVVFRSGPAPWIAAAEGGYQDWYLLQDSCALDVLNEAAVSPACREAHDRIARQSGGGTAGLYRLWHGEPDVHDARMATWFAKPVGMTYETLRGLLTPATAQETAGVWGRQMVLGPTPEFGRLAPHPGALPGISDRLDVRLHLVWPGQ